MEELIYNDTQITQTDSMKTVDDLEECHRHLDVPKECWLQQRDPAPVGNIRKTREILIYLS